MAEKSYSDFVNIDKANEFKREAQAEALRSNADIGRFGLKDVPWTMGESVHLIESEDSYLAHVIEGLGTKNMIADEMGWRTDSYAHHRNIGHCTANAIFNDMSTLGAQPVSIAMHVAAGSTHWFNSADRRQQFLLGWREACDEAGALYRGGESSIVRGMVTSDTAELSGSAIGIIKPKSRLIRRNIQAGDAIVFLESSGLHANGFTLARKIAEGLRERYLTKMPDGQRFGDALLKRTHSYVKFVQHCLDSDIQIRYGMNITGHGLRKIMRAPEPFEYVIEKIPTPHPEFSFIAEQGGISLHDMYADYNMRVGYALIVPRYQAYRVAEVWKQGNYPFSIIYNAGYVRESDKRRVVIKPLNITFEQEDLQVR